MKKLIVCAILLLNIATYAQISVVPQPASLKNGSGIFIADPGLLIVSQSKSAQIPAGYLIEKVKKLYGLTWVMSDKDVYGKKKIILREARGYKPESYDIEISENEILIKGHAKGLFYGVQTLLQLMPVSSGKIIQGKSISVPQLVIRDSSRLSYRGMHLDVARHFFTVNEVKEYIDYLAMHKFNTFHWHLTDDQGWRIEIKKYPLLTEIGSCRDQTLKGRFGSDVYDSTKHCGFYTQEEIKDVIRYAKDRYITIIPEVDIPGHSLAAMASYPFLGCTKGPYKVMETWGVQEDILCAGNDSTFKFMENVLDEVMSLFPSQYIHIGGDEAPKNRWKACAVCQQRIKKEGLKDEHELQSYFIKRMESFVNSKGKKIIGWDEILEGGLAPNATVMSWRGIKGGIAAAKMGHDVIMTPETPLYINHQQSRNEDSITQGGFNSLEMVYNYEPIPQELTAAEAKHILGAQGNVWAEYISNTRKLQYTIFPRMSALSEVLWTGKENKNWERFQQNLPALFDRYRLWGVNFSTAYYDLQPAVIPLPDNGIGWELQSNNKTGNIIYVKGREISATNNYTGPIRIESSGTVGAALTAADHTFLSSWLWQDFKINKASGKKATLKFQPNTSYAGKGAFTLVDGVQNEKQMVKSAQFLGFLGKDMEVTIDLGKTEQVNEILLHAFEQPPSWIYRPSKVSVYASENGNVYTLIKDDIQPGGKKNLLYRANTDIKSRYIKIIAVNFGKIPAGSPGGGTNAWLFVDEVEVN